jgi:hypothetical protein
MSGIARKHGVVPKPFWGRLQYPPPPKKIIFFQRTQNFSRKRVWGFSNWRLQENVFNRAKLFGWGGLNVPPHLTPQIQCLPGILVVRARPRGHVRMATQQEGSFCVVSTWDHDKQLFGRALDSNKSKRRANGRTPCSKKMHSPYSGCSQIVFAARMQHPSVKKFSTARHFLVLRGNPDLCPPVIKKNGFGAATTEYPPSTHGKTGSRSPAHKAPA